MYQTQEFISAIIPPIVLKPVYGSKTKYSSSGAGQLLTQNKNSPMNI